MIIIHDASLANGSNEVPCTNFFFAVVHSEQAQLPYAALGQHADAVAAAGRRAEEPAAIKGEFIRAYYEGFSNPWPLLRKPSHAYANWFFENESRP